MDKKYFYEKEIRAKLATYNPYLKNEIKKVRVALGIPELGFPSSAEASKWYNEHFQNIKGNAPSISPPWNWHLPKELAEMLDSFAYTSKPSRVGFDPEVPLDNLAMKLIRKFGLPEKMVNSLKSFILKEEHNAMNIPSALQEIFLSIDEGEEGTKYLAIVAGLDESTTEEQWLNVWRSLKTNMRLSGKKKPPNRRYEEKLTLRDLTLWRRVKKDGRTIKEVLDDWIERHPDNNSLKGEDTVKKAIKRIDDLMQPVSNNVSSDRE